MTSRLAQRVLADIGLPCERERAIAAMPTGRFTTPQEVATLVALLASPLARNVTGSNYVIDGQALGCRVPRREASTRPRRIGAGAAGSPSRVSSDRPTATSAGAIGQTAALAQPSTGRYDRSRPKSERKKLKTLRMSTKIEDASSGALSESVVARSRWKSSIT